MVSEPNIRPRRYQIMTLECPDNHDDLFEWLIQQCKTAPSFMSQIAVALSVTSDHSESSVERSVEILDSNGICVVGLTGDSCHRTTARTLCLTWLSEKPSFIPPQGIEDRKILDPKIIHGPVRSGIQIYAKDRDLIIIGQVSEGAEIMSDGHTHVYGRLRGRVAVGVNGKTDVQLFCLQFEPELISIAGLYVRTDQIPNRFFSKSVRVCLDYESSQLQYSLLRNGELN